MFVGHLAVALAAKPAAPTVSLGILIGAAFGLDLLWPLLLLLGVEQVSVQPGITAFTPLNFESYPWSHSLMMAIIWGAVLATLARPSDARARWVIGGLVMSHWVLDVIAHRPDLPVWPGGPLVGFGLWNSVPATFIVEGALLLASVALYSRSTTRRDGGNRWVLPSLLFFTIVIWASGPFSPPPPGATAIAIVGLAMWLFPLWGHWIERTRDVRRGK